MDYFKLGGACLIHHLSIVNVQDGEWILPMEL